MYVSLCRAKMTAGNKDSPSRKALRRYRPANYREDPHRCEADRGFCMFVCLSRSACKCGISAITRAWLTGNAAECGRNIANSATPPESTRPLPPAACSLRKLSLIHLLMLLPLKVHELVTGTRRLAAPPADHRTGPKAVRNHVANIRAVDIHQVLRISTGWVPQPGPDSC